MKEDLHLNDDVFLCPNCQALNHPNAIVCIVCGVRLDTYREVSKKWLTRQSEKNTNLLNQLTTDANETLREETKKSQRIFGHQILILIIVAVALIPTVWGFAALITYQQRIRTKELETQYQRGVTCLKEGDYLCAEEAFKSVYQKEPEYSDIKKLLINTQQSLANEYIGAGQTQLALSVMESALALEPKDPGILQAVFTLHGLLGQQYAMSNRWQDAIEECEKALILRPGHQETLDRIENYYDGWYQETVASGNLLKAWRIKKLRDTKFPRQSNYQE